jgi:hypothetical protein
MPGRWLRPACALALSGLLFAGLAGGQVATSSGGLAPGVLLLARAENHIKDEFQRLAAVSCLETAQREVQRSNGKMQPLDTVRLEVLTNGDRELFASPGDRKFSERQPVSYIGSGMVSNGLFGPYLKDILLNGNATTKYKGDEDLDGRKRSRYDYQLAAAFSGQSIHIPEGSGDVGLHGSFWVDPATYDVVRLDLNADHIPPTLPLAEFSTSIRYARTILGGRLEVLLPESADVRMVKNSGDTSVNQIQFTQCQVFGAESKIDFDVDPDQPARFGAITLDDTLRPLPAGLRIRVKLKTPISSETTVGTLIDGVVATNVRHKQTVVIPAGSPVRGRVRRLEYYRDPVQFFVIGLEFTEVEIEGVRHIFYADLLDIDSAPGVELRLGTGNDGVDTPRNNIGGPSTVTLLTKEKITTHNLPGVATFFLAGDKLELPRDFGTMWKTRPWKP